MTTAEIVQRYLSDAHAAHEAFDNEKMSRFEFDETIEHLDAKFFHEIEPQSEVVLIDADDAAFEAMIDKIKSIGL